MTAAWRAITLKTHDSEDCAEPRQLVTAERYMYLPFITSRNNSQSRLGDTKISPAPTLSVADVPEVESNLLLVARRVRESCV